LSATATQILFNFSATSGYFFFDDTPSNAVCWDTAANGCITVNGVSDEEGTSMSVLSDGGEFSSLSGTQAIGTAASSSNTPEPSTLALLGGGAALVAFRKWRSNLQQRH
jgi:hypothetical protein